MSLPTCPDCGRQVETLKVGDKFFVFCQAVEHRTRKDNGYVTQYGNILSNGHDAPGQANEEWTREGRRKQNF